MNNLHVNPAFSSGFRTNEEVVQKISENKLDQNQIKRISEISKNISTTLDESDQIKLDALAASFDVSFEQGCKFLNATISLSSDKVLELISSKFGLAKLIEKLSTLKEKSSIPPYIYNFVLNKIMKGGSEERRLFSDETKLAALSICFDVSFDEGYKFLKILEFIGIQRQKKIPTNKVVELIFNRFGIDWILKKIDIIKYKTCTEPDIYNSILNKIMKENFGLFLEHLNNFDFNLTNAIDFFEVLCDKNNHSLLNKSSNLKTVLNKFKEVIDYYNSFYPEATSREDIKKLIKSSKLSSSSLSTEETKSLFNEFFKTIINEHFKIKNVFENDGSISITIEHLEANLDDIAWYIQTLLENRLGTTININFSLSRKWECSKIRQFIQEQGKWVTGADLSECSVYKDFVNNDMLQDVIKYCPGINKLHISSDELRDQGLQGLSSLSHLKTLEFSGCRKLANLPVLPMNLQSLVLEKCNGLTSLPVFPVNLQTFCLSDCKGITEKRRFETLSTLFDASPEQGLKFIDQFNIPIAIVCTHIQELDIKENDILFKLARQVAEKNVKAICQNIHKFSLTEEQRTQILKIALKKNALTAAESIQNFGEIHDQELLKKIARSAIFQSRSTIEKMISSFGFKNTDEIDECEVNEFLTNIKNKNEDLLQEQLYKFDPHLLELCGKALYQELKTNTTDFYANWTCKFLERAAKLNQQENKSSEAVKLRLFLAQAKLIYPGNPLSGLEKQLQNPILIPHPKGNINYGTAFSSMGSQELKGGHFRVRDITLDDQNKRVVTFNVTHCAADEVRANLQLLKKPNLAKLIEKELNTTLEVYEDKNFCYYTAINGKYDSTHPGKVETSPALTVHLNGLAKIQIGTDPHWGSMLDSIHITLESGASPEDLQKVFSLMGLTNAAIPSTEEDIKRLKVNFLIHFFYPKLAAMRDRIPKYFMTPIPQLLKELEKEPEGAGLTRKVYKYLDKLEFYEIDGEKRLRLSALSDKAEQLGARGLYTGISSQSVTKTAETFASIMQSGLIPTEKRLELGWTDTAGASMKPDLKSGGARAGFYRILTQSALDKQPPIHHANDLNDLNGYMQILFKTKILKLMPYFYSKDSFGNRNPYVQNVNISSDAYTTRPNLSEFVKENEKSWEEANEVMLKVRLSPKKYIAGVVYQDPRKILVADIEEKLQEGALPDTYKDFFSNCTTLEQKVQFISDHREDVLNLLKCLRAFKPSKNTYKEYDVFEHWTVDPKSAVIKALEKEGVPYNDLLIQEADAFNNEFFSKCNNIEKQLKKVKREAMAIAGTFKSNNLVGSQIADNASQLIDAIRKHFSSLSEDQLRKYLSEEVLQKITRLKKACGSRLYDFDFSGQDSLNRELLTGKWTGDLRDKDVILALFALEALQTKNADPEAKSLITFLVNDKNNPERSIPECLYCGLETHHPALLEKLLNNLKPKTESPLASQVIFLNEYIRRSKIEETFLPILTAINQAYEKVLNKAPDLTPQHKEATLNVAYESKNWKDNYLKILSAILDVADNKSDEELLKLMATRYSPADLKSQALDGFNKLMEKENLQTKDRTVEQIIHAITTSFFLLDPMISHVFYDRLHILAALKSNDPIATKDGNITMRDLMLRIMNSFKEGVTEQNAIAAEQFYLRMVLLYEKLIPSPPVTTTKT
jgi:hypothetical protein